MMSALKSEFLKLTTLRFTYGLILFALAIIGIFAFWVTGYRADLMSLQNPGLLANNITSAVQSVAIFGALATLRLVVNEFRHNTSMYTLTLANSRTKVMFAKIIIASLFGIVFTVAAATISPLLTLLGVVTQGGELAAQTIPYSEFIRKVIFFGWAYAMLAVSIALLLRNQIAAIATLLLFPTTAEPLLGLLQKDNASYLPFTALFNVITDRWWHGYDTHENGCRGHGLPDSCLGHQLVALYQTRRKLSVK